MIQKSLKRLFSTTLPIAERIRNKIQPNNLLRFEPYSNSNKAEPLIHSMNMDRKMCNYQLEPRHIRKPLDIVLSKQNDLETETGKQFYILLSGENNSSSENSAPDPSDQCPPDNNNDDDNEKDDFSESNQIVSLDEEPLSTGI